VEHQARTYVRKVMLSSCVSLFFCLSHVGITHKNKFISATAPVYEYARREWWQE